MADLLLTFVASLLLGMRHATDPDHIVAVTTIVSRERSLWKANGIGVLWGLGHTLTIFLVGGVIVVFKLAFSARLGLSLELSVAVMLIVLGVLNLTGVRSKEHAPSSVRPFFVGIIHGLAGSAAATLLILPLIEDPRWAVLYLAVFGIGTIIGMATVTLSVAAPAVYAGARVARLQSWLRVSSGAVSLAFGIYLTYKIGLVDGLFTSAPHWTPR